MWHSWLTGSKPLSQCRSFFGFQCQRSLHCTSHPSGSMRLRRIKAVHCRLRSAETLGISKWSSPPIVHRRPLSGARTQKIVGSIPCPRKCMTDLVVISQPLSGSRHGQERYLRTRCGWNGFPIRSRGCANPILGSPFQPSAIQRACGDQRAPGPS